MKALERLLIERIERGGPMPFAAYMSQALYHPRYGYYSAGEVRTGWSGHFVTSPELDPAFGALWANGFERIWELCGNPARFDVVEVGPGEGSFAAAVLAAVSAEFARALHYRLVERVPRVEQRQRERLARFERVEWTRSIDEVERVRAGCVFANEVLDNLPVHLVEMRDGELNELCVTVAAGRLELIALPPANPHLTDYFDRVGIEPRDGYRYEIPLAADSFVERSARALARGAIVLVDYGATATQLADRPGGSLVCYSSAGADADPLAAPGDKDITVHANWTSIQDDLEREAMSVTGPRLQADALRALGIGELDERLKTQHASAVAEGRGSDAVAALSRRQALSALLDRHGMGGLDVVMGVREIETPSFMLV